MGFEPRRLLNQSSQQNYRKPPPLCLLGFRCLTRYGVIRYFRGNLPATLDKRDSLRALSNDVFLDNFDSSELLRSCLDNCNVKNMTNPFFPRRLNFFIIFPSLLSSMQYFSVVENSFFLFCKLARIWGYDTHFNTIVVFYKLTTLQCRDVSQLQLYFLSRSSVRNSHTSSSWVQVFQKTLMECCSSFLLILDLCCLLCHRNTNVFCLFKSHLRESVTAELKCDMYIY